MPVHKVGHQQRPGKRPVNGTGASSGDSKGIWQGLEGLCVQAGARAGESVYETYYNFI